MDKETAERLTKAEGSIIEIKKELEKAEKEREKWLDFMRQEIVAPITKAVIRTVTLLIGVGTAGLVYGWHMPENVRKLMSEWVSK